MSLQDALSLLELQRRAEVPSTVLLEWIEVGWLRPLEEGETDPYRLHFPHEAVVRVRALARLARELDLAPDIAVLVQGLIDDRRNLEQRLARLLRHLDPGR
jgi:hypothetical protein